MAQYKYLNLKVEEGIGSILLNRPPSNAMNDEIVEEMDRAFHEMNAHEGVKVLIITSALKDFFMAGADIKMSERLLSSGRGVDVGMLRKTHEAFNLLQRMPKMVIAAINGHALGAGCELAMACDFRFMAKGQGRIGLPEIKLGLIPGSGGTQRLTRLLGRAKAMEMMIKGLHLTPEQALEVGLVNKVFPPESLMEETMNFAKDLANGPTKAMGLIKKSVNAVWERDFDGGIDAELEAFQEVLTTKDAVEGVKAFVEKRKAKFTGA